MAWPYNRRRNWAPSLPAAPRNTPAIAAEMERIDAALNSPLFSGLAVSKQDFIHSIKTWAASKGLTDGQLKFLSSIEKDLIPHDSSWWDASNPENIAKRAFIVAYYKVNGYWLTVIPKMEADPTYMPDHATWAKMWDNKFVNARYGRFIEGNKHNVGDIVTGKFSYVAAHQNGVVQNVTFNFHDGRWHYDVLCFETGSVRIFKDTEVRATEKRARKPRAKKPKA